MIVGRFHSLLTRTRRLVVGLALFGWIGAALTLTANPRSRGLMIAERLKQLSDAPNWELVASETVSLKFPTFHPQGLVRIGQSFFMSSVHTIIAPQPSAEEPKYDRTAGKGDGYLFQFDASGKLINHIQLGGDTIFHPGGVDFDGESIWVPVAEYRPKGRTIVYKVNPQTLAAVEAFSADDHIGAIAVDRLNRFVYGLNWDSELIYRWGLDGKQQFVKVIQNRKLGYQDCEYLQQTAYMVCGGVIQERLMSVKKLLYFMHLLEHLYRGGIDLIDLESVEMVRHVPVLLYTPGIVKRVLTQNPTYLELREDRLKLYFVPEDNDSTLYVFNVD